MDDPGEDSRSPRRKKHKHFRNLDSEPREYTYASLENNNNQKIKYLLIKNADGEELKRVSPFIVNKAITACCGEPTNIKRLRDGSFLVECNNDAQAHKLLKLTSFYDVVNVKVEPHKILNRSKGVIRSYDLMSCTEEEICQELKSLNVVEVKQVMNKRRELTPMYILTFETPNLPQVIKAGYLKLEVRPYIPAPLRCFRCYKFGHITGGCRSNSNHCKNCSSPDHIETDCPNPASCCNCQSNNISYDHDPLNISCPTYQKEKKIKELQVTKKIPYSEARKLYDQIKAPMFSKSYAEKVADRKSCTIADSNTSSNGMTRLISSQPLIVKLGADQVPPSPPPAVPATKPPAVLETGTPAAPRRESNLPGPTAAPTADLASPPIPPAKASSSATPPPQASSQPRSPSEHRTQSPEVDRRPRSREKSGSILVTRLPSIKQPPASKTANKK